MVIVRAESLAEAARIAERDSLVRKGLRTSEVRGWQLNEARLVLTVDLHSNRAGIA